MVADGWLHNSEELTASLGDEVIGNDGATASLILSAYLKWGEDCPGRFLGEFAFAVWDARKRTLFCCRDQLGIRPFLYWSGENRFAFSGRVPALLRVPDVPLALNREKLAAMAVATGHHFYDQDTFHKGIKSLPGGTCLTVSSSGRHMRTYWHPERGRVSVPEREDDAYQALHEIVCDAVRCRLPDDDTPLIQFSGGLDSSVLAVAASEVLQQQGRSLVALSAVPPDEPDPRLQDEREFMSEFEDWGNLRVQYVSSPPHKGPFDLIGSPERYYDVPIRTAFDYLYGEIDEAAAGVGSRSILTGNGGELGLTAWGRRYPLELLFHARWRTLIYELRRRSAVTGVSPIRTLGGPLRDLVRPWRLQPPSVMLTREFRPAPEVRPQFTDRSVTVAGHELGLLTAWLKKHSNRPASLGDGSVSISRPFLDRRILEFCLSTPAHLKVRNGYPRCLARYSFKNQLPERVRWRTSKTPFSPDYYIRFNSSLHIARDFVKSIRKNDPVRTIVDVDGVEKLLRPVDPIKGSFAAQNFVPFSLYFICFLRQFPDLRP